jgi:hypothetical protein
VLRRAAALLQPGAPLVISTPRLGSLTQRCMGAGWTHYKTEHLYYFTADNLRALLARAGFTRVRHGPAWKTMTLDYLRHQFEAYRHPLLTPLARFAARLPRRLQAHPFALLMGEMLVVARGDGGTAIC